MISSLLRSLTLKFLEIATLLVLTSMWLIRSLNLKYEIQGIFREAVVSVFHSTSLPYGANSADQPPQPADAARGVAA